MTGHDDGAWREAGPAKAEGVVWAVISGREADDGVEVGREGQLEVEFFSVRPRTPDVGGEVGNWPSTYFVYEGNLDGGTACWWGGVMRAGITGMRGKARGYFLYKVVPRTVVVVTRSDMIKVSRCAIPSQLANAS